MRTQMIASAVLAVLLAAAPDAFGQQDRGGLGGALDTLNRTVNPNQDQDRRARDDARDGRDQRSGSADRASGDYRRLSDRDLRDEASRLDSEAREIERDRRAVEDEMSRRGMRR